MSNASAIDQLEGMVDDSWAQVCHTGAHLVVRLINRRLTDGEFQRLAQRALAHRVTVLRSRGGGLQLETGLASEPRCQDVPSEPRSWFDQGRSRMSWPSPRPLTPSINGGAR